MQAKAQKNTFTNTLLGQFLLLSVCFGCAFLFSRTVIFELCPISTAFISSVPAAAVLPAAFGSALGSVTLIGRVEVLKYLISAALMAFFRIILGGADADKPHLRYIFCFVSVLGGAVISGLFGEMTAISLIKSGFEAAFSVALTFFFCSFFQAVGTPLALNTLDATQIASVLVTASVLLSALNDVTVFGVSVARILAVTAVLSAAVFGRETAGAIGGIAFGAAMSIGRPEMLFLCGGYALGGLMAGVFSRLGSFPAAVVFSVANAVFSLMAPSSESAIVTLYEVLFASVLFMLLPKGIKKRLSSIFSPKMQRVDISIPQKMLSDKLDRASAALTDMGDTVQKIGEVLGVNRDIHAVMKLQFESIAGLLDSFSEDLSNTESFDSDTSATVEAVLKAMSLHPKNVYSVVDKSGRLTVNAVLSDTVIPQKRIAERLSLQCDRALTVKSLTREGSVTLLTLSDQEVFSVDFGASQYTNGKYTVCGDAFCRLFDRTGRFYMLLSDGMGSGSRAAVDGRLTVSLMSRLLAAGFDGESALELVNSALLFKSGEESLSTLDIAALDLKTGKANFYKAGTPPTYIRKNGLVGTAGCTALPIGILEDVGFDQSECTLSAGDIIVMLSDGATECGDEWIKGEIKQFEGSASSLAKHLLDSAVARFGNHEDDVTVLVAIIKNTLR